MSIDYPDFLAPQAAASLIANGAPDGVPGGTPLLVWGNQLVSQGSTVITVGTPEVLPATGSYAINQPGYEVLLSAEAGVGPTYFSVQMAWYWNGTLIESDLWWLACGSSLVPHQLWGRGPTKGNQLVVTITPFTNNFTMLQFSLFQTSHIPDRDDWRSLIATTLVGLTTPNSDPTAMMLASRSVAGLAASGTDTTVLPAYAGRVRIYANTASHTNDLGIQVKNIADQGTAGNQIIYQLKSDGNGNINDSFSLPRAQCSVSMTNGAAAAENVQYQLVMQEY